MGQRRAAHGGVERCEQQVLGHDARSRYGVEKARFSGVGVTDQSHDRIWYRRARAALELAGAANFFEALFEDQDAVLNLAPVGFDLGFARSAEKAPAAA